MVDTIVETEHKTITNTIDDSYIMTIYGVSEVQSWLQRKSGPIHLVFMGFYKPFFMLFCTTSKTEKMLENKELCEKVNSWMNDPTIDINRMNIGIGLFQEYQESLFKNGILTIKR